MDTLACTSIACTSIRLFGLALTSVYHGSFCTAGRGSARGNAPNRTTGHQKHRLRAGNSWLSIFAIPTLQLRQPHFHATVLGAVDLGVVGD